MDGDASFLSPILFKTEVDVINPHVSENTEPMKQHEILFTHGLCDPF